MYITALVLLLLTVTATAAPLPGSLAFLRCGSLTPVGVCTPGTVELAAMHVATGAVTTVLALPNATIDSLELQNLAVVPSADALFVSLADGAAGQLLRISLSTRAVVSTLEAPACGYLSVDDVSNPTHALCLTDAPYYGNDGRSYLLRLSLVGGGGAPKLLATWAGSPVALGVVAAYHPTAGVLYAVLPDEATDELYLLGWNVSTGALASQVAIPDGVVWVGAAWDTLQGRMLGIVDNDTSLERVVGYVDLASGTVVHVVSTALTRFTTVYSGTAVWAPGAGSLLATALGSGDTLRLVGVNATSGQLDCDVDASGLLGSFVYVGGE